jgi:hypothetical protein
MEVCAFSAQQRFLRALSVSVAIPEVINVTLRARFLRNTRFARSESRWLSLASKSVSKIKFSSFGHICSGGDR